MPKLLRTRCPLHQKGAGERWEKHVEFTHPEMMNLAKKLLELNQNVLSRIGLPLRVKARVC